MNLEYYRKDFENLDIQFDAIENVFLKEVIDAYRKKVRKVHPDKNPDATAEEKELNNSYQRILKIVVTNHKNTDITDHKCSIIYC